MYKHTIRVYHYAGITIEQRVKADDYLDLWLASTVGDGNCFWWAAAMVISPPLLLRDRSTAGWAVDPRHQLQELAVRLSVTGGVRFASSVFGQHFSGGRLIV
jgi:hypothetical protein